MRVNAVRCRICGGQLQECLDFGRQPVSNGFIRPEHVDREHYFRLAMGVCVSCTMVQQLEEVPRARMFHADYPYRSSESAAMREHFERTAAKLIETELKAPDAFFVEIGCNDGIMLTTMSAAGVRHLGVDPSARAAETARANGAHVEVDYFEESSAARIRAEHRPADVVYSANTISHISYIDSIFRGMDVLLAPKGIFVLEERYLGDIVANTAFDQIYDEHFYLFAGRSVQTMAARFGFELVDIERLPVHGGSIRFTIARPGVRRLTAACRDLLTQEESLGLAALETYLRFRARVEHISEELVTLLRRLHADGRTVVGYGATSRSATVTNYCGIGPGLVPFICDTTTGKHGRLTPGSHIPIRPAEAFSDPYPDYALLFAWNHADEIMAKERVFRDRGGKWILYMPHVHIS
jgi:methylation protein EvaC